MELDERARKASHAMSRHVICLVEHQTVLLNANEFTQSEGEMLLEHYEKIVSIEFPSPKTRGQWALRNEGWSGYVPLSERLGLSLAPKVPLQNLFQMLEYAYTLRSFRVLDDLVGLATIEDVASQLARMLALRVLERARRGFSRTYVDHEDDLAYVAGRLNVVPLLKRPWETTFECTTQHHTANIDDNAILLWTLFVLARSPLSTGAAAHSVRAAYRSLYGLVQLRPYTADDCVGRRYHRLNEDYRILHALCRFFLAHTHPSHMLGEQSMLPFLVPMAPLFEVFVREWLRIHLPDRWRLKWQEAIPLTDDHRHTMRIDLVLIDQQTGHPVVVMDTKYKAPDKPSMEDIYQMVTYATAIGAHEAILIYPSPLAQPLDVRVRTIRVRSLTFSLGSDLEAAGSIVLKSLLGNVQDIAATM